MLPSPPLYSLGEQRCRAGFKDHSYISYHRESTWGRGQHKKTGNQTASRQEPDISQPRSLDEEIEMCKYF